MEISILCYNLSGNSLGRAFILAELLEGEFDIEIIGPKFDDSVWSPMSGRKQYKGVETSPLVHRFPFATKKLLELITGDAIIACKPRTSSYGIGLVKKATAQTPVLLDIDDWESGFYYDRSTCPHVSNIPHIMSCNSFYYTRLLEWGSKHADRITVSNTFLQSKFGGTLIPHVRNTDEFSPDNYNKQHSRRHLGIPIDLDIVMFAGSPAPYKGVDDLIRAFPLINASDCQLYIVGADDSGYSNHLRKIAGENVNIFGKKPFDQLPHWIAAADIIAVPQRARSSTRGQLPAKLFDAMALGKPILATAVGDIPNVLEGAGVITEPGDPSKLKEELSELINDTEYMEELGNAARRKCVEEYSYAKYSPILSEIVERLV